MNEKCDYSSVREMIAQIISIIGLMVACFCLGFNYALSLKAEQELEQVKQMLNRPTLSARASYE